MTSLTIFSKDTFLQSKWQGIFSDASIQVTTSLPENKGIWVLDCAMLPGDSLQGILDNKPERCFALVDKNSLTDYGAILMDAEIPLLQSPLNDYGIQVIKNALKSSPSSKDDASKTQPITYSSLAEDFAFHSNNPNQLIKKLAGAVRDTMRADWVAFIRVTFDENEDYTVEVLGMEGDVEDENSQDIIRRDGYTLNIMDTRLPIVIPDIENFYMSDIEVNPRTIESGFKAGLGLPLLPEDGKPFGVMWVMYRQPRRFAYKEVRHMQVYASHVALAYTNHLQKKLVNQWQKAAQRIFTHYEAISSLDDTLQHITDGIHESLDCDVVTLYLYQPQQDEVTLPYHKGVHDKQALHSGNIVVRDSIIYDMLEEPAPLILENAPADKRFGQSDFLKRESIQSLVAIPLKRSNEKVGVMFLNYRTQRHFTDDEREAIHLLTNQIAVSILNARLDAEQLRSNQENIELLRQLNEQGEQLQTLVKVIDIERNLNNQDRDSILNMIASQTAEVASADRVTIRLVQDEHVAALAVYPKSGDTWDEENSANWGIREGGHSHLIVKTNLPVVIDDVDNYDPAAYNNIEINPKWQGVWKARIGLPLTSGNETIGVMWLSFKKPRKVTHTQLSAFQSFANIAFLTKMYDIEQERLQHALKIMTLAHQSIHAETETDTILHHTMELARRIVSSRELSTLCQSHLAVVHNQSLIFKPEHNDEATYALLQEKLGAEVTIPLDYSKPCLVVRAVQDNETILINDVREDERFLPLLHKHHSGSQLSVPIRVADKVLAIVSVEHVQMNSFEWYDRATLEWLASFVGQVIRNRQQQQMRDALFESSRAITEGKDLQSVLQSIAEHAHRVIEVKRGAVDHDAYVGLRQDDMLIFQAGYPGTTLKNIEQAGLHEIDLNQEITGISGMALLQNDAILVHDTRDNTSAFEVQGADFPPLSLMSIPILNLSEDQPALGVISLGHRETDSFDEGDKEFIMLLAKFAAVAIRRAQEIDAQTIQRESLFELTHAAMDQVIASHDIYNYRMIYNFDFPRIRVHLETLIAQKEEILKTINDSQVYDDIEGALRDVQTNVDNLDDAYQSLIERDAQVPELGDVGSFPVREWLWTYHKENDVHLQIDSSLKEGYHSVIPRYWLREVIKIVITNARRALERSGYSKKGEKSTERLIKMVVLYNSDSNQVKVRISNPGKPVPVELRHLLTQRIIPRHLRKNNDGGRGIGLFMSGIIMRAYDGEIRYLDTESESTFVLSVPIK